MIAPATVPSTRSTPFCKDSDIIPVAAMSMTVVAAVCGCGHPRAMGIRYARVRLSEVFMAYCNLTGEGVGTSAADDAPSLTSVAAILSLVIVLILQVRRPLANSLTDGEL